MDNAYGDCDYIGFMMIGGFGREIILAAKRFVLLRGRSLAVYFSFNEIKITHYP